jgi:hypothetical protein
MVSFLSYQHPSRIYGNENKLNQTPMNENNMCWIQRDIFDNTIRVDVRASLFTVLAVP